MEVAYQLGEHAEVELSNVSVGEVRLAALHAVEVLHSLVFDDDGEVTLEAVFAGAVCTAWHHHHLSRGSKAVG